MQRIRSIRVTSTPLERLSLEQSLHSAWQWLKYSGLHPNLLLISVKKRSTSDILRGLFTIFILLLLLVYIILELFQLIVESWRTQKMVEVAPNFILISYPLFVLLSICRLWSRRHQIESLCKDWMLFEMKSNCSNSSDVKRVINGLCAISTVFGCCMGIFLLSWNLVEPERSFFPTYHPFVRETFGLVSISAITASLWSFITIFVSGILLPPIILFYHMTCVVENLVVEWNSSSKNGQRLQVIWQRYEVVLHLVDRVNDLYGAVINGIYFLDVFNCCLILFNALEQFQKSMVIFSIMILMFIFVAGTLAYFNQFMSRLYFSKEKLQKSIANHLSQEWYEQHTEDRQLLVCFLARLGKDDLAVRPMKLYIIKPGNMLSIFSLIINYFIVLAQARK